MKHLLIFLFSSGVVFGASVIFSGDFVKTLKDDLKLGETARIVTGTADPSSSATDGEPGSIYIRNNGGVGSVFFKTDTGSSTNWSTISDSATVTEIDGNVNDLITLSGESENSTAHAAMTGTVLSGVTTTRSGLQALGTQVDTNTSGISTLTSSKATTELDNLGTTAINAHLLPDTPGTYNLGSSSAEWNNIFGDFTEFKNFRLVDNSDNIALSVSPGTNVFTASDGYGLGLATANATSTQGQTFTTGNASSGNSGGFTFTAGTATGTRGSFNADANIINLDFDTSLTLNSATVTTSGSRVDFTSILTSGDVYIGGATGAFFDVSQDWMGLLDEWALRFYDNDTNYTGFKAPTNLTGDVTFTLPDGDGSAGQVMKTNGSGTLAWVNQPSVGSNLETDPYFQEGIGSWTEYDNADMDTISTDNITVTASATSTQIGADPYDGNVQIAVGGSSASGDGIARTYTVGNDVQDAGCIYIKFKYGTSTGFSTGDFILAARRANATAADLTVQGLDGSAQLIGLAANGAGTATAKTCYKNDITSLRIGFEVASATTNIDLFVSGIEVTLDAQVDSPVIEKITFDETNLKMWNTTTDAEIAHAYTLDAIGQREGEWLYVTGKATASASSSVLQPLALHFTGYTISTDTQTLSVVGSGEHSTDYGLILRYNSTTADIVFRDTSSGIVYAGDFDSGEIIGFNFKVKIADWENQSALLSTTEMLNQTVKARYTTDAGQSIDHATLETIDFEDVDYDTHSAVTTGAGWVFTCPKSGYYKMEASIRYSSLNATAELVSLELQENGTAFKVVGETLTTGNFYSISASDTVYCEKGNTLRAQAYQATGAAEALETSGSRNVISIEEIPDFSVYGVYGKHEIKYAESSAINLSTGGTSGDYLQTSVSVTLEPGVWEVRCTAELVGATSGVSQINFNLYEADGDGTGTPPTSLGTASNYTVDYNVPGLLLEDADTDIWERHTTVAYADLTVTTADTFYCVPRYNYTSATGNSTVNIRAKRLQ